MLDAWFLRFSMLISSRSKIMFQTFGIVIHTDKPGY